MKVKKEEKTPVPGVFKTGSIGLIGRPNVGKSTLLNRILGEKLAIVSDKPQTTRNRILGIRTDPDAQFLLIDTPGLHKPKSKLNESMVRNAVNVILEADLIFLLMEMGKKGLAMDADLVEFVRKDQKKGAQDQGKPIFLVITKADLVSREELLPVIGEITRTHSFNEIIPVSASKNENIDHLMNVAKAYLPEGPPLFPEDEYTDQPLRFIAAEVIREKIIQKVYQEVPYSVAVKIETYEEKPEKNQVSIKAVIYVDRASQKGILIGRRGESLKKIGTEARLELEKIIGKKIYLETWVEVSENWKNNDQILKSLGYE
ncbi:MAG: GTPase Era [Nitrospirae bacterium]|nr:GTPase Era [Nitrospirota bacterium]